MASAEENAAVGRPTCWRWIPILYFFSAADIRLHPTVVMSIADTHTRSLLQFNKSKSIGALFGTQRGREVRVRHICHWTIFNELTNCFCADFRHNRNFVRGRQQNWHDVGSGKLRIWYEAVYAELAWCAISDLRRVFARGKQSRKCFRIMSAWAGMRPRLVANSTASSTLTSTAKSAQTWCALIAW